MDYGIERARKHPVGTDGKREGQMLSSEPLRITKYCN